MATVTHLAATPNTAISPLTSDAFTPAASDLLVAFVVATGTVDTAGTMTGSTGLTFVKAGPSALWDVSGAAVHCFIAEQLATAVSQTVTFDSAADPTTGQVIFVAGVGGMIRAGAAAVRQTKKQDNIATASFPSTTFDASCLTDNPTFGCVGVFGVNPPNLNPPVGWSRHGNTGYATPVSGATYIGRAGGFTGTIIAWATSTVDYGNLAVELDASPYPLFPPDYGEHPKYLLAGRRTV